MAPSPPEQESDPPPEQELHSTNQQAQRPRINRSICHHGRSPTVEAIYGTTEGDNARRLLQAREDEDLQIHHRRPQLDATLPRDLYGVLPPSTRKLLSKAYYQEVSDGSDERRMVRAGVTIAVARQVALLGNFKNAMKIKQHDNRVVFYLSYIETDVAMIQYLSSVIGNICERRKYHGSYVRHPGDKSNGTDLGDVGESLSR
jgi:hypothetical protein